MRTALPRVKPCAAAPAPAPDAAPIAAPFPPPAIAPIIPPSAAPPPINTPVLLLVPKPSLPCSTKSAVSRRYCRPATVTAPRSIASAERPCTLPWSFVPRTTSVASEPFGIARFPDVSITSCATTAENVCPTSAVCDEMGSLLRTSILVPAGIVRNSSTGRTRTGARATEFMGAGFTEF